MKELIIQGKKVKYGQKPFIIAEVGVNHNGDLQLALDLIDAAAFAGADAIKFQTFRAEQLVTATGKMADYQKRNLGKEESQLAMLKKLELPERYYPALIQRAKERKIIFFSTPHGGVESVDFLQKLRVPAFKFGSGDLTNLPLLEYTARLKKPMIIATGMSNLQEVKEAVAAIKKAGNSQIVVLHCTTDYPCKPEDVNLRAMQTFMKELGVLVGYSDHTTGPHTAIMATVMGACVLEKHFTVDRTLPGPDQIASMEPLDFKGMIKLVEKTRVILGSAEKKLLACERQYITVARKSLVAKRNIKKGAKFTTDNITIKRPGDGILPKRLKEILGKTASQVIPRDTVLQERMIG